MKIEKSNNPLAAGALVLVLLLIVGRIGWMLLGRGDTASAASPPVAVLPVAATPVAATPVAVRSNAATLPAIAAAPTVTPRSARNPFSRLVRSTPSEPLPRRTPEQPDIPNITVTPIAPLAPMPIHVPRTPKRSIAPHPTPAGIPGGADGLQTLKLTAIIGGQQPMAILQTAQPEPVILHIGDHFDGMRVVAINDQDNDQDVVFARGEGLWTLSLPSAGDKAAPDPVSVAPSASEENSDELH